jgi:flagellar FliL protein
MSATATASKGDPVADAATPAPSGKKKKLLVLAGVAVAVLAAGGGGGTWWMMKKRAAAAAEAAAAEGDAADDHADAKPAKVELKNAPVFTPLDPFTVNLADRDTERYAQVGITLELADPKAGDLLKAYMPAIRNNILLALGSKTAAQLAERDDKLRLAEEIRREALRPLGYELAAPAAVAVAASGVKRAAAASPADEAPIRAVHFSNFIVQ